MNGNLKRPRTVLAAVLLLAAICAAWVSPVQAQELGLEEPFDDPSLPGWEHAPGAEVADGVLHLEPGGFAGHGGEWGELTLTVVARRLGGDGGLVVSYRCTEAGSYHVLVAEGFLALQREAGGEVIELEGVDVSPPTGEWFELTVFAAGEMHTVVLNGEPVLAAADPDPLPPGSIGLEALGNTASEIDLLVLTLGAEMPPFEGMGAEPFAPEEGEKPPEGEEPIEVGMEAENWFVEEFDDGFPPEWERSEQWQAGESMVWTEAPGQLFFVPGRWTNMTIAVRLRRGGPGMATVLFRATDEGAYRAGLAIPESEEWHDLVIVAEGGHLVVRLDELMEFDLLGLIEWPGGGIGIVNEGEGVLAVDRLEVMTPVIPLPPPEVAEVVQPPEVTPGVPPEPPPEQPPQPAAPPPGMCVVTPPTSVVNLRGGPGTNYNVIGNLSPGDFLEVVGRNSTANWYAVDVGGQMAWVSSTVVNLEGPCQNLSVIQPPAAPPGQPPAQPGQPPAPTQPPAQPGQPPTPTQPPPPPPAAGVCLDSSLATNYGSMPLSAGFTPDPFTVSVVSGGNVDVTTCNLPASCVGFATAAPDYRLFWSGTSSFLRIFFVGPGDSTLVVHGPMGGWHCNDDSHGTFNPAIALTNPPQGAYEIWVGSYTGPGVSGTLYITELTSVHPGNLPAAGGPTPAQLLSADLAVTDIFPASDSTVWFRITNNGPDSLSNASVPVSCRADVYSYTVFGVQSTIGPNNFNVTVSANPGQTGEHYSGIHIGDTTQNWYDITCSVSFLLDPTPANDSYNETIPPPP